TGGTLDKLEAIPGFRTGLSLAETRAQVMKIGCAMIGQTPEIAPADGRIYALRDVTGTVEAIPLISASIMSKKLAEGLNALVLDVKRGSGAFPPALEQSLELARTMIALGEIGCAMIGQTPEIAPADGRIYALRDVTGTVEAIPLISASIMAKKLAEGLNALVLDVKRGSGAFLPALEQALGLAQTMIAVCEDRGCPTVALLTAMDRPLGRACGNALETEEAILALRGEGPPDLMEVTYAQGVGMLLAAGVERTTSKARKKLEGALGSGLAAEKFEQLIEAQGGNPRVVEDPAVLPQAQAVEVYAAAATGVIARIEPRTIGRAVVAMGGGRLKVEDAVDPTVGFVISAKPGDKVLAGEPIASVYARDASGVELAYEALGRAIVIVDRLAEPPLPLVSH